MTLVRLCVLLVACGGDRGEAPSKTDPTDPTDPPTTTTPVDPGLDSDDDGVPDADDCAPDDPTRYPGAADRCGDDLVADCTRTSDDGLVTVAGVFTTTDLAEALATAVAGDEVLVCPGTYTGPFVLTVPLVVQGHGDGATLSGGGTGTTIEVVDGTTLRGLTITGGNAAGDGGGVHLPVAGAVTIESCQITGNEAIDGGGLAVAAGGTVTLMGSEIVDNVALGNGGGLLVGDGAIVTLEDSSVHDNQAARGGGVSLGGATEIVGGDVHTNVGVDGGGVYLTGDGALTDCAVHDNTADHGGGVYVVDGLVTLSGDTVVSANTATRDGGGIAGHRATIQTGAVSGNVAVNGGGVWMVDSQIRGVEVLTNEATGHGGGIHLSCETEEGCSDDAVVDCTVNDNTAGGDGGGVWLSGLEGLQSVVEHVVFVGNSARSGGAVFVASTNVLMVDAEILGNVATVDGGGVRVEGSSPLLSEGSAWGAGADDNEPSDVDYLGVAYGGFVDEDFSCTSSTGCG